jgi:hypothetical protein
VITPTFDPTFDPSDPSDTRASPGLGKRVDYRPTVINYVGTRHDAAETRALDARSLNRPKWNGQAGPQYVANPTRPGYSGAAVLGVDAAQAPVPSFSPPVPQIVAGTDASGRAVFFQGDPSATPTPPPPPVALPNFVALAPSQQQQSTFVRSVRNMQTGEVTHYDTRKLPATVTYPAAPAAPLGSRSGAADTRLLSAQDVARMIVQRRLQAG